MEIARHFTSCLCVRGRIGLSIASLQVLSFLFTFFITAPSPFSWAPLNFCFRCAAPSFPLPFLICVSAGGVWCIHTEKLGDLAGISFHSSAALPFSLGLAVLTLTVRSTALLWALEAAVSSSECFGNSCLLCGERVPINLISLSSGRLGVAFTVKSLHGYSKGKEGWPCSSGAGRPGFFQSKQRASNPVWERNGLREGSSGPPLVTGTGCSQEGETQSPREGEHARRKGATWWKWLWLIITQPVSHTFLSQASEMCPPRPQLAAGPDGAPWEHANHCFCFLPVKSLDYNGNPARPFVRKVQQGSNVIHHLLEGALVGYLLEIY